MNEITKLIGFLRYLFLFITVIDLIFAVVAATTQSNEWLVFGTSGMAIFSLLICRGLDYLFEEMKKGESEANCRDGYSKVGEV
jgi:hypothetical protein